MRRLSFVLPIAILLLAAPASAASPIGYLNSPITGDTIGGWAYDPGATTTPIQVSIYIDGPAGSGVSLGTILAADARPDVNAAGIQGNHGFSVVLPATVTDGNHSIYAYGISGTSVARLRNSPQPAAVSHPRMPIGYLNSPITGDTIGGWAYDPGAPTKPIQVSIYIDGPAGSGVSLGTILAADARPDVNAAGIQGNHGFSVVLPATVTDGNHSIYAYGISGTSVARLRNSPQPAAVSHPRMPIGYLQAAVAGKINGWALDQDDSNAAVTVRFYLDGPSGIGTNIGSTVANIPRPDVNKALAVTGNHGFAFELPTLAPGSQHKVFAYALDLQNSSETKLNGSPQTMSAPTLFQPTIPPLPMKLIDSFAHGYKYGYAPSIIKADGTWHMYFCSTGSAGGWDDVRHSTSQNGTEWSSPVSVLHATDLTNERATCDPSVVYFDAGDGPYYYLFYTGNQVNVQGVNFVARSASPNGPFLKYTRRGTWENNPTDPFAVLLPLHAASSHWYGLGQPSVIVKDGILFQWFTDTTRQYPTSANNEIYLATSTDAVTWSPHIRTDVSEASVDVKYDPALRLFEMFSLAGTDHTQSVHAIVRTSDDGIRWSAPKDLLPQGVIPPYAHNIGVSGSRKGELLRDFILLAYGAPYGLETTSHWWGYWDLYGQRVSESILPQPTPGSCVWNNQIIAAGASVIAYESSTVPAGRQCVSQTRTCVNGVFSGSYQYPSCTTETTRRSTQLPSVQFATATIPPPALDSLKAQLQTLLAKIRELLGNATCAYVNSLISKDHACQL